MPKIIENLQQRLLDEARRQIETAGYSATTIRSIAKAVGVGVGTVYNYFSSKDDLLATYMLLDWMGCIAAIEAVSAGSEQPEAVVRCIHDQVLGYARQYQALFQDSGASASFAGAFSRYHALLRSQLSAPLGKFCESGFAAEFIAEAVLTWTMAGRSFDEIYGMTGKLFAKGENSHVQF